MADEEMQQEAEVKTYTQEEVQALIEKETTGLKSKVDELLGEKKTVAQRAKELEEAQAAAEQERLKEKEEFKTLWEREQQAKKELQEKYETFSKQVQQKEVELASSSIAAELTRDTKRAELLKEQIAKFARYTDEGVKYEMGGVEVGKEKIVEHLTESYGFLIDGSQATGGGATGSKGSGAAKIGKVDGDKKDRAAYFAQKFDLK
jgi:ribosomal protein L20